MLYAFRIEDWISKSINEEIKEYEKLIDITNRTEFYKLLEKEKISLIFSYYDYNNFTEIAQVLDNINLLVKLGKVEKIIFISSYNVYKPVYGEPFKEDDPKFPRNTLGINAFNIENTLIYLNKKYNVETNILRLFSLYGPYMNNYTLVSNLFKSYIQNKEISIGDVKKVRDYLYIDDLIQIINKIYERDNENKLSIYNIGTNNPHSIRDMINKINDLTKKKPEITFDPEKIRNEYDHDYVVADNTKLLKDFPDLEFTPLEEGLELTYKWLQGRESNV